MNAFSPDMPSEPTNSTPVEQQDKAVAQRFLSMLDPECSKWHFRTIEVKGRRKARKHNGTLDACWAEMVARNNDGAGVYVVINEGGQEAAEITRVRAVFADLDGTSPNAVMAFCREHNFPPHVVVQSSPGKFHVYWRVEGLSTSDFKEVQQNIAARFGGDKTVNDLPRIMRLSGTFHTKNGGRQLTQIIHEGIGFAPYTAETVLAHFGPQAAAIPSHTMPPPAPVPSTEYGSIADRLNAQEAAERTTRNTNLAAFGFGPAEQVKFKRNDLLSRIPDVVSILDRIPANKGCNWSAIALPLRSLGELGWAVVDEWSKTATDGSYHPKRNREAWDAGPPFDGGIAPFFTAAAAYASEHGMGDILSDVAHARIAHTQQPAAIATGLPQGAKQKKAALKVMRVNSVESEEMKWLIEGLIPKSATVGLVGKSGDGKSFIALAACLSIATGKPFLDHDVEQGSTLYLCGEGAGGIKMRCKAWAAHHSIPLDQVPFYMSASIPPMTDEESVKDSIEAIIDFGRTDEIAHQHPLKLIVVDTLARAFGGEDENSAKGMTKFIAGVDRLRESFPDCTIMIVHHMGHEANRARGSSAFYAALDTELTVCRKGEEQSGSGFEVMLNVTKQKDTDRETPLPVKFVKHEYDKGKTSLVATMGAIGSARDFVIREYMREGKKHGEIMELLKNSPHKIGKNTLTQKMNEIRAQQQQQPALINTH